MQIKKRLQINSALPILTAFIITLILSLTLSGVNRARLERELVGELLSSSFERITFRSDYLRKENERAKIQWFIKSRQITQLLKSASDTFADSKVKKNIGKMIDDNETALKLFSDIVANRERARSGSVSTELSQEVENRLVTQLNMRLYDSVLRINLLRDSAGDHLLSALTIAGWGILFIVAFVAAAATINSWSIGRTIITRLQLLQDGASMIGRGNLDHRIEVKGDDEFVDLSTAFNRMTDKLSSSYHELQNEIVERTRAEETVRGSEERYRALINASSQVLYHMSPDWSEMRQLQGGSFLEDTEKPNRNWLQEYIHPDDRKQVIEVIGEAVRTGTVFELEHRVRRVDNSIGWTFSRAVPLRNEAGEIVEWFGAASDITDRKRAEEELQRTLKLAEDRTIELESANKELEAFSYSLSHDLRTPLRSISAFSEIMLQAYSDKLDEKGRDYLLQIKKDAERLNALIYDVIKLSIMTRSEITKASIDLSRFVRDITIKLMEVEPGRKVDFIIQPEVEAHGDPALVRILLENLLENAWKFTGKQEKARIEFGLRQEKGEQVYFVKDNGIGFDMSFAQNIFTPFQRLHRLMDFPGTGIGLASVQRIVHRHGGRIWVEAEEGKGATFFFTLGLHAVKYIQGRE